MQNVTHRLQQYLTHLNLSTFAFETQLGIGKGSLNKPLKNHTSFGVNVLQKIGEKFPNLNMDWLINGRGSMVLSKPDFVLNNQEESIKDFVVFLHKQGVNTIPLMPIMEQFLTLEKSQIGFNTEPKENNSTTFDTWKEKYYNLLEKYTTTLEQLQKQPAIGGGKKTGVPVPGEVGV